MIKLKRIYDSYDANDGYRILVDRLWPRGISKQKAKIDLWLKDLAPSTQLRQWFGHDVEKWPEFVEKYKQELHDNQTYLHELKTLEANHGVITLLYAARDTQHNEAIVLTNLLRHLAKDP